MQARLRVLLAGNFLSGRGGARAPIEDLADKLEQMGYECLRGSSIRTGMLRGAHLILTAVCLRRQYDLAVLDLYSGRAFLWGEALSKILSWMRCPFVISLHGGGLPGFASSRSRRMTECLRRAAAVTAPSRYLVEQMQAYRADIMLLPNALAVSDYPFRLRGQAEPRLIWVRAFHRIYNPMLAPAVLDELKRLGVPASLTMVGADRGDGSLDQTRQEVERLGLSQQVVFTGGVPRSEVPKYVSTADIFINTTNVDNTPVSVLEAMACGLCVVTTDAGGIRYLLRNESDALIVPANDPGAMARAIFKIIQSPRLAERLSGNARAFAAKLDWPAVLPKWERLLQKVAPARRPDAPHKLSGPETEVNL